MKYFAGRLVRLPANPWGNYKRIIMSISKSQRRTRIHYRVRKKVQGTPTRPRLSVYRSNKGISCQLIDDVNSNTLLSATHREVEVADGDTKQVQAKKVGLLIAEKAKQADIDTVVFDRGGYLYHGRVKALADGARENGLKF